MGRYSPCTAASLADEVVPLREPRIQYPTNHEAGVPQPFSRAHCDSPKTIAKSARYPRVAIVLGVNHRYHVPLLICRSLSTIFAIIWTGQACSAIHNLPDSWWPDLLSPGQAHANTVLIHRLHVTQVGLSFLWVSIPSLYYHSTRLQTCSNYGSSANYLRPLKLLTCRTSLPRPSCLDGYRITLLPQSLSVFAAFLSSYLTSAYKHSDLPGL